MEWGGIFYLETIFMAQDKQKVDMYMPLWIGDYLADTSRLHWAQHGPYLLLIMDYWRKGPLPDNDLTLSTICGMSADEWLNIKTVLAPFFRIDGGQWHHKRIEKELKIAREKRNSHAERGLKGAQKRWDKGDFKGKDSPANSPANSSTNDPANSSGNSPANSSGNSPGNAQAMLKQWPSSSSSSSSKNINKPPPNELPQEGAAAFQNESRRKMTDAELNLVARIIEKRVETGRLPGKEPIENTLALKNTLIRAWEKDPEELRAWRTELKKDDRIRAKAMKDVKTRTDNQAALEASVLRADEDEDRKKIEWLKSVKTKLSDLGENTRDKIIKKAIERTKKRFKGFPDSAYHPDSDIVLREAENIIFREGIVKQAVK